MSWIGQSYYRIAATRAGQTVLRTGLAGLRACGVLRPFRLPLEVLALDHPLAAELLRLWSRIHWAGTDGMMPPEQLLAVVRLAYECPAEGDTVELGAWVGLTTVHLAAACQARGRGDVFAVDTFAATKEGGATYASAAKYGGGTLAKFHETVRASGMEARVHTHVGLTTEMADRHCGRPIRFLFIDADHSYDGVKADFEAWSPYVAPGGFIVFHDYAIPDVQRFVDGQASRQSWVTPRPGQVDANVFAITKDGEPAPAPRASSRPACASAAPCVR
jgi:predicted O-methyltransferase YrrM